MWFLKYIYILLEQTTIPMSIKPPHLESEEEIRENNIHWENIKPKFSQQGPSKYGKWGSRVHKAAGRKYRGKK